MSKYLKTTDSIKEAQNVYLADRAGDVMLKAQDILNELTDAVDMNGLRPEKAVDLLIQYQGAKQSFYNKVVKGESEGLETNDFPALFLKDGKDDFEKESLITDELIAMETELSVVSNSDIYTNEHFMMSRKDLSYKILGIYNELSGYGNEKANEHFVDGNIDKKSFVQTMNKIADKSIKTVKRFVDEEMPKFLAATATIAGTVAAMPYLEGLANEFPATMGLMAIGGSAVYLGSSLLDAWNTTENEMMLENAQELYQSNAESLNDYQYTKPETGDSLSVLNNKMEQIKEIVTDSRNLKWGLN